MSANNSNHLVNPAAREAMDKFKMEAAADPGALSHLERFPAERLEIVVFRLL